MSTASSSPAWIVRPRVTGSTRVRLFCFPYAGGGASAFFAWREHLPAEIDLCLVQLPGRETRLRERGYTHLPALIEALVPALLPYLDQPFVLFGHSLGAMISFELTRALRRRQMPLPLHLVASGCRAPHLPSAESVLHALPDSELMAELKRLNGTPAALLADRELMELLLPLFRADFALFETYEYLAEAPLPCPITALGGLQDTRATGEQVAHWREQTSQQFALQMFPGGHFFLHESRQQLLEKLLQMPELARSL